MTGFPGEQSDLQSLAVKHGLNIPSKLLPVEEALACALLASRGVGAEVVAFENETKIVVCRNISLGAGGASQSRFRRKVHVSILAVARNIEHALQTAGLDYDLFTEESDFGLERAEFTVYAHRTMLNGIVRPSRSNCIQVRILPVCSTHIRFTPIVSSKSFRLETKQKPKILVGIDPGTTCGIAVLTLDGRPIRIESHRNMSRGDLIRVLAESGDPVLFASDVVPHPQFLAKLAKSFDAVVFEPESDLSAVEKQAIAKEFEQTYKLEIKDQHQRDALAAVAKAFNHYKAKFVNIEDEIRKLDIQISMDDVKTLVIRGYSIQNAISSISLKKPKQMDTEKQEAKIEQSEERIKFRALHEVLSFYKQRYRELLELNRRLNLKIKELESKVTELSSILELERRRNLREIRKDRDVQTLRRENESLRKQLEEIRLKFQTAQEVAGTRQAQKEPECLELLPLKPLESFTRKGLEKALSLISIRSGDIVFSFNSNGGGASTANELLKRGIRAVVSQTNMPHQVQQLLEDNGVPVIFLKDINLQWVEGRPYVSREDFEKALAAKTAREKVEAEKSIQQLLQEYRRDRLSRA
ncbi:MAG: DUF460 domain-containing protein [Candidatus Bathyarchaeia archaeon]